MPRRPPRRIRPLYVLLLVLFIGVIYLFSGGKSKKPASGAESRTPNNPPPQSHNSALNAASNLPWSKFAYIQYASGLDSLCHSLIIFDSLAKSGSTVGRVLVHPHTLEDVQDKEEGKEIKRLLKLAQKKYRAVLKPVERTTGRHRHDAKWTDAYNKFQAWNQTDYERLIYLDSDALLLNSMDELFLLPPTPLAHPRAYWQNQVTTISTPENPYPIVGPPSTKHLKKTAYTTIGTLSVMLITPSRQSFSHLTHEMDSSDAIDPDVAVEEILTTVFGGSALVLPHRPYILPTGEFRDRTHQLYLAGGYDEWDARKIMEKTKYIHFSDGAFPKPWVRSQLTERAKYQPGCLMRPGVGMDCSGRDTWLELYSLFGTRREQVCDLDLQDP